MTTIRALIVHGHDGLRRAMHEVFDRIGRFEVAEARNGAEALEQIRSTAFDVITVDVKLPEVDGCELIEVLERERPEDAKKIIVLTGTPRSVRARIGPHYPILSKPFNTGELLDAVSLRVPSLSGHGW